jgi:hypothetical protein
MLQHNLYLHHVPIHVKEIKIGIKKYCLLTPIHKNFRNLLFFCLFHVTRHDRKSTQLTDFLFPFILLFLSLHTGIKFDFAIVINYPKINWLICLSKVKQTPLKTIEEETRQKLSNLQSNLLSNRTLNFNLSTGNWKHNEL